MTIYITTRHLSASHSLLMTATFHQYINLCHFPSPVITPEVWATYHTYTIRHNHPQRQIHTTADTGRDRVTSPQSQVTTESHHCSHRSRQSHIAAVTGHDRVTSLQSQVTTESHYRSHRSWQSHNAAVTDRDRVTPPQSHDRRSHRS